MSHLAATLKLDVRLQARAQLYAIGVFVAVLMGCIGRFWVSPHYAGNILAVFYLCGLGGTTYMFGASLVLLEKSDGTLQALCTSPLQASTYLVSKVATLTAFSLIESAIVFGIGFVHADLQVAPLLLGIIFLGILYTLIGLGQVASYDSVTSFLFPNAMIVSLILQLPLFWLFSERLWFVWLIPTHGCFLIMLGASKSLPWWQWGYAFGISVVAVTLAYRWTLSRMTRCLGLHPSS